jgi:hypothetical protein
MGKIKTCKLTLTGFYTEAPLRHPLPQVVLI